MAHPALERAADLGTRYEDSLPTAARRRGAHYTPPDVAESVVGLALEQWSGTTPRVVDPACGAGIFLVAATQALLDAGLSPAEALRSVRGCDLDPDAVHVATTALGEWARAHGLDGPPTGTVVVDDGLSGGPEGRWEVVVGNPPFQNQLGRLTARDAGARRAVRRRFGTLGRGFVDTAALFLARAVERSGPGGVVAMLQPRSVLGATAATELRTHLAHRAPPVAVWVPGERLFEADVDVVAVVLAVGEVTASPVSLRSGRDAGPARVRVSRHWLDEGSWAPLSAAADGVPEPPVPGPGPLVGDVARVTAGFRDQYYGLVEHTVEDRPPGRAGRLVTVGAVDPGRLRWGDGPIRFARRRWSTPWVDLDGVGRTSASLAGWVDRLSVPKVLVASQTRVVEAAVDEDGDVVPVTPLVSVVAPAVDPWMVAAALTAPPVSALAHWRLSGTGMAAGTLRLGAAAVAALPLPTDDRAWRDATRVLAGGPSGESGWIGLGERLSQAHGVDDSALVEWWWVAARRAIGIDAPVTRMVT